MSSFREAYLFVAKGQADRPIARLLGGNFSAKWPCSTIRSLRTGARSRTDGDSRLVPGDFGACCSRTRTLLSQIAMALGASPGPEMAADGRQRRGEAWKSALRTTVQVPSSGRASSRACVVLFVFRRFSGWWCLLSWRSSFITYSFR